ncbi:hypothetical protein KBD81_00280 [Candidatus Woesebacteria bacterium]|nr:hypothetical protein [Candidatus Woesebacteria bacterium]
MTVQEHYSKYQIIPSLQLHQYRVASVGLIIGESMVGVKVDIDAVVKACLLHDMGNIIKFNMELFPQFFEPEGVQYWIEVKRTYIEKYGQDEHDATIAIAREILSVIPTEAGIQKRSLDVARDDNVSSRRVLELIEAIGFSNAKMNWESDDFSAKIAAYADMRVEPFGVTSLRKRLEDGNKRFKLNKPDDVRQSFFEKMSEYLKRIEGQIFLKSTLTPEDITEEGVKKRIPELRSISL